MLYFIMRKKKYKILIIKNLKKASAQVLICSSRFKFGHHSRWHTRCRSSDQRVVLLRVHGIKIGRALLELWRRRRTVQHETTRRCAPRLSGKRLCDSNLAAALTVFLVLVTLFHAGVSVDHVFKAVNQNERFCTEFVF